MTAFNFDALEEARGAFWTSTHKGGTEHDALNAIAAAQIAQAEQTRRLADAQVITWQYITSRDGANAQRWSNAAADALQEMARKHADTDAD